MTRREWSRRESRKKWEWRGETMNTKLRLSGWDPEWVDKTRFKAPLRYNKTLSCCWKKSERKPYLIDKEVVKCLQSHLCLKYNSLFTFVILCFFWIIFDSGKQGRSASGNEKRQHQNFLRKASHYSDRFYSFTFTDIIH